MYTCSNTLTPGHARQHWANQRLQTPTVARVRIQASEKGPEVATLQLRRRNCVNLASLAKLSSMLPYFENSSLRASSCHELLRWACGLQDSRKRFLGTQFQGPVPRSHTTDTLPHCPLQGVWGRSSAPLGTKTAKWDK